MFTWMSIQHASNIFALSCEMPDLPHIEFDHYDAVIIGQVKAVKNRLDHKVVTVEVNKSYKGITKKTISVIEDINWGTSKNDETYLYFLNKEKNRWTNPLCSPTTSAIGLADQYLADKAELPLEESQSILDLKPKTSLAATLVIFLSLLIISAFSIMIYFKRKKL